VPYQFSLTGPDGWNKLPPSLVHMILKFENSITRPEGHAEFNKRYLLNCQRTLHQPTRANEKRAGKVPRSCGPRFYRSAAACQRESKEKLKVFDFNSCPTQSTIETTTSSEETVILGQLMPQQVHRKSTLPKPL